MSNNSSRQLAAILFADIAGYTALMQKDEQTARLLLEKFRSTLNGEVVSHQGKIVQYYGDGCLCTFSSAVNAVACAKAVQRIFQTEPKVPVRIGLHSGDVFFEANNVYGDTVNIASRIESLGIAGSVLFSKRVKRDIANQTEFKIESLGEFHFKNVEKSMEVFALANGGLAVPKREEMMGKLQQASQKPKYKILAPVLTALLLIFGSIFLFNHFSKKVEADAPNFERSIAVLPFKNMSAAEDNQFFCDGVMEAVNNHLSKIEGLRVIASTSSERYRKTEMSTSDIAKELDVANVLEGSVQRSGNKVRISARLILAKQEQQIWSGMYDRELDDIFKIQSEIAENIANELKIELSPEEKKKLVNTPTENMEAYEHYLRGRESLVKFYFDENEVDYQNATQNFEKALELDSLFALAYVDLARTIWMKISSGFQIIRSKNISELDDLHKLCEKALSINPELPEAHYLIGQFHLSVNEDERFVEQQLKALAINENYAEAYAELGNYYVTPQINTNNIDYEKGINYLKTAVQLDPTSSWTIGYYEDLAIAYTNLNDFETAEKYGKKVREAGDFSHWSSLAHIYMMQGKYGQTEELVNEWLAKTPYALRYLTEIEVNHHQNYKKAIELYIEFEKHFPDVVNFRQRFGLAYWLDGQKEKGRQLLNEALKEYDEALAYSGATYYYDRAGVHATLGDTAKAMAILRNPECDLPVGLDHYILIDPLFKNLWDNEEFQQIVKKRQEEKAAIREQIKAAELKG